MRVTPVLHAARAVLCIVLGVSLTVGENIALAAQQNLTIRVVSGDGMELLLGSSTAKDVIVEVVDGAGKPVSNVSVAFVFPGSGRAGGTTELGQYLSTAITDDQGRASIRVKPSGPAGAWTMRVTAGPNATTIAITNVTEASSKPAAAATTTPSGEAPAASPGSPAPANTTATAPKKNNHLALILVIVAAGAGGGIAAALAGKKGSSTPTVDTTGTTVSPITIIIGSGGFAIAPPR